MTKHLKRFAAGLAVVALLAGCSGNASPSASATPPSNNGGTTGQPNEFGWVVPEKTISFTVYMGQGDQNEKMNGDGTPEDPGAKPMLDWLKNTMNVDIKPLWFPNDMVEKLNLMLTVGDYPEVITWMADDMANKFISQKRTKTLDTYVEQYGDTIQAQLGKYIGMLRSDDGSLQKLLVYWGENQNVAGWDFGCRYDLWKETGLPMYTTLDDYYNVLKKIVEMNPTNKNGDKVYALSTNGDGKNNGSALYSTMLAAYGFKNGYKVDASGNFTHWMNTEEGLEISKYINRFYREGLIEPDFLSNNYESWLQKTFQERIIGNIGTWWHLWTAGHEKWIQEDPSYTIEKRFMNATIEVPGVTEPTYLASNYIGSYRTIITDKASDALTAELIQYFNWEMSTMGSFIMGMGQPSPDNVWEIVDGKWIFKDNVMDSDNKNENFHNVVAKFGGRSMLITGAGGWIKDDRIDPRVDRVSAWDLWAVDPSTGGFLDPGVNITWGNVKAKAWDSTLFQVSYDAKDPISTVNTTIREQIYQEWAKIITCKTEAECEAQFYKSRDALNSLGLNDLTAYNQEQYKLNADKIK